jgi:Domain of unknown function (DUF4126)
MFGMETLIWVSLGVGLASVAGVRGFLPLALVALFWQLNLLGAPEILDIPNGWTVVEVLAALAVLEIVLDKIRTLEPVFGFVMIPVRIAAGAVLFAVALEPGTVLDPGAAPGFVAGGVIAGLVAVLKVLLRPSARTSAAGVSTDFLSAFEDVVALVGCILALLVPWLPLVTLLPVVIVAFLLFFYYRVRRRRGRKFGGLRILGD